MKSTLFFLFFFKRTVTAKGTLFAFERGDGERECGEEKITESIESCFKSYLLFVDGCSQSRDEFKA